ncbi:MAG: alpha/beta fold hydrolase [Chloroflexota bacterium]|nr:alpha/beta fold hydrolase [Chloroflexota bacterium]
MSYSERSICFENQGQKLYGFLHLPDGVGPHPAVALLHGFGGNHIESHALFPKASRALASAGIGVLRFDFRGSGNSEGLFRDVTLETEMEDAEAGLRFLAEQPEVDTARLGLIGLSLGGLIAASVAARNPAIRALVLWAPVAHLGELFQAGTTPERTQEIVAHGYTDYGGLEVSVALVQQALTTDPITAVTAYDGPALLVHGTGDTVVPASHSTRYQSAMSDRAELELIEGADHVFSSVRWEHQLIERTVSWLRSRLHAG